MHPNPALVHASGGHPFSYDTSQGGTTFRDPENDAITYSVGLNQFYPGAGLTVSGPMISGTLEKSGDIDVYVNADDGHGGSTAHDTFHIVIDPNKPPTVVSPNLALITTAGAHVDYDLTKGGTVFEDADGDTLTYEVAIVTPPLGLSVDSAHHVIGSLDDVGMVSFEMTARDEYGGSAVDRFTVAVPAPEPGKPTLPATSYVYDDAQLPLPPLFRFSRDQFGPFWDTTLLSGNEPTNAGATLGRVLFYDKRLSITNTHACGSCHHQAHGFASPEPFNTGVAGVPLKRNAMALVNARYNLDNLYFSDRRVMTLENLVPMPIEEPSELGNFMPLVVAKLAATDFYPPLFEAAFGTPEITEERVRFAIAQFVRSLISYRTKFDAAYSYRGSSSAPDPATVLTAEELWGSKLFEAAPGAPCSFCHVSDVQEVDVPANNGLDAVPTDPGVGGGRFRAASLRNIAVTGPYMHDGRFATLREVIDHYDHGLVGSLTLSDLLRDPGFTRQPNVMGLSEEDKNALEAFLLTLTDDALLNDPKFADPFL